MGTSNLIYCKQNNLTNSLIVWYIFHWISCDLEHFLRTKFIGSWGKRWPGFGSRNLFDTNFWSGRTFLGPKFLCQQFFWTKKFFEVQLFFIPNYFGIKILLGPKIFFGPNYFCLRSVLESFLFAFLLYLHKL